MLKSILKRIFYMLIVVWVVSVMAFILMRCAPGDPTATMLLQKNSGRLSMSSWA